MHKKSLVSISVCNLLLGWQGCDTMYVEVRAKLWFTSRTKANNNHRNQSWILEKNQRNAAIKWFSFAAATYPNRNHCLKTVSCKRGIKGTKRRTRWHTGLRKVAPCLPVATSSPPAPRDWQANIITTRKLLHERCIIGPAGLNPSCAKLQAATLIQTSKLDGLKFTACWIDAIYGMAPCLNELTACWIEALQLRPPQSSPWGLDALDVDP